MEVKNIGNYGSVGTDYDIFVPGTINHFTVANAVPPLLAGENVTLKYRYSPNSCPHSVNVTLDPLNKVETSNLLSRNNNNKQISVPCGPDLVVYSLIPALKLNPTTGKKDINLTFNVKNVGNFVSKTTDYDIFAPGTINHWTAQNAVPPLKVGEGATMQYIFSPNSCPQTVNITVDYQKIVTETNENNNAKGIKDLGC